jgi:hypothetical protein
MRPRLRWLWEAVVVFALYQLYELARARVAGSTRSAYHHALQVVSAERRLHIYWEHGIQHAFIRWTWFLQLWDIYYGTVHFVVPVAALVLLWRRGPERFRLWRNVIVSTTVLALVGFALYPLMPPRLMPQHFGFLDTAARVGGLGPLDKGSMKDVENLYAAMPSLHIGWSTWCACALFPVLRRPWTRALIVAYPLATLFAIVVTANHWILDGAGGVGVLAVGYGTARAVERVRSRRPEADAPPAPVGAVSGTERNMARSGPG